MYDMSKTEIVTIRADPPLRQALEERARASGTTISHVARAILREGLAERPLAGRIGHLKGTIEVSGRGDVWRERLRERNWRE